jgi:hypothetical protein
VIDNQTAYDRYFPTKVGRVQSRHQQEISVQTSTAAGFASQTSSTFSSSKSKTSQSVSHVDGFEQVNNEIYFREIYKTSFSLERMKTFLLIYQEVIKQLIQFIKIE